MGYHSQSIGLLRSSGSGLLIMLLDMEKMLLQRYYLSHIESQNVIKLSLMCAFLLMKNKQGKEEAVKIK